MAYGKYSLGADMNIPFDSNQSLARDIASQRQEITKGSNDFDYVGSTLNKIGAAANALNNVQNAKNPIERRMATQNLALTGLSIVPGPVGWVGQGLGIAKALSGNQPVAQKIKTNGAMQSRMQALEGDNFQSLIHGTLALADAPQEIRQQYAEPLLNATMRAAKERGYA